MIHQRDKQAISDKLLESARQAWQAYKLTGNESAYNQAMERFQIHLDYKRKNNTQ